MMLFPEVDLPREIAQPASSADLLRSIADGLLWVADDDPDRAVGFIACERAGQALHILEMDVLPSHGRRGVGAAMLQQACSEALRLGASVLTLTTFAHLPWNAPFYARHGFAPLPEPTPYAHLDELLAAERSRGLNNRIAMARPAD